jgi:hypothetical protein
MNLKIDIAGMDNPRNGKSKAGFPAAAPESAAFQRFGLTLGFTAVRS